MVREVLRGSLARHKPSPIPRVVWKCRTDSATMQKTSEANSRTANKPILFLVLTNVTRTVLEAETKALRDVQDPQKISGAKHE